jgi:hypothetical protein
MMSSKKQAPTMQKITLGLAVHRPEMIPLIADRMQQHEAIFLEEPPTADFEQMLNGALTVDDYLKLLDVEYPVFSREMCYLLRKLAARGAKIIQVEPFLEILLEIHGFFARGHRPQELDKNTIHYPVYLAEHHATRTLLAYYQTVMTESFERSLEAVEQFARRDAARFRLRDSLRAQALGPLLRQYPSAYIEAGVIHLSLWRLLRQRILPPNRLRLTFLADFALQKIGSKGHMYGPGDQLTLLYLFHPDSVTTEREQVLAARSIIYSKIIEKEELTDDLDTYPHIRDELACIRTTQLLSLDDCRRLFPLVRDAKSSAARQLVTEYTAGFMSRVQQ